MRTERSASSPWDARAAVREATLASPAMPGDNERWGCRLEARTTSSGHARITGSGEVGGGRRGRGFTLLEVMIAMAIFFMAVFAILGLVAQNLQIARNLSRGEIDVSTVAVELTLQTLTNREMSEGLVSGDFGETYPGASWSANLYLVSSNAGGLRTRSSGGGLYQADITINWPQNDLVKEKQASLLLYRPNLGGVPGR